MKEEEGRRRSGDGRGGARREDGRGGKRMGAMMEDEGVGWKILEEEGRSWILDGNHRLQKAIDEGHATIRAKILRGVI